MILYWLNQKPHSQGETDTHLLQRLRAHVIQAWALLKPWNHSFHITKSIIH